MLAVTPPAAKRVLELCRKPDYAGFARPGLRVKVVGGGCAGLSYEMEITDGPREGDAVLAIDGAEVFVDRRSVPFLEQVTLDFRRSMLSAAFEFRNPAATGTCGCGASFSV